MAGRKKGAVEIGFLIWMSIGLLIILIGVAASIYAKNHGMNLIDYIKSFFSFG